MLFMTHIPGAVFLSTDALVSKTTQFNTTSEFIFIKENFKGRRR